MTKLAITSYGWPSYRSSLLSLGFPTLSSFFDWESDSYSYKVEDDKVSFEVELPGFKKDQVTIEVIDSVLYIKAKTDKRSVKHSFGLGRDVDGAKAVARLEDGILTVELPRVAEAEKAKTVIKVS